MSFILRKWSKSDADSLVSNANNFNIAKFMTDGFPHPYTVDHATKFIDFAMKTESANIFAIDVNGLAVGGIGLHSQHDIMRKNAELGYWLGEQYWGQGIVTEAIKQIVDFGFSNLDITRIYARPFHTNLASQKVLLKAGFIHEATLTKTIFKNGEFLDECIYSIRKN